MTLTELRYVVAVAGERHFGRAAERCFVSQPTLSVAVRKLEEELGVVLFERHGGRVRVTPEGEPIIAQARRALEEADTVKALARAHGDQLHGALRIGLIFTIGPYLLPDLVPRLRERAPQMPIVIEEGYTADLRRGLREGRLDVAVLALPFTEPGVLTRPVYDEPFVIVVPAAHPWVSRDAIPAADLAHEDLLLLGPGHCFREQVIATCPECVHPQSTDGAHKLALEGGSLETIRHMVASGLGVTVLPTTAAGVDRYSRGLLAIRRFAPPVPSRRVALAWRDTFPRPKAVQCVLDAVTECPLSGVAMPGRRARKRPAAKRSRPA